MAVIVAGTEILSGCDKKEEDILKTDVMIEAGSEIRIEDFFTKCPPDAAFLSDVSGIDTSVPAVYKLTVSYGQDSRNEVTLRIEDHTGPVGKAVPQAVYTTWKLPDADKCVEDLYDLSGIAKVEYQGGNPKFDKTGKFDVPVAVTDTYGNTTVIEVPFSVTDDRTAPLIYGVHDIEFEDDIRKLNYFKGVTVKDDYDQSPVLRVNDQMVNYGKSGTYDISYSAMDKAGNIRIEKAKITLILSEEQETDDYDDYFYYEEGSGKAYEMAADILSGLLRDSDVETARAIFNWVHSNIYYQHLSYYQSFESAAARGFSRRSGDCYVFFACAKMLLDCAGIPNLMVERYPVYEDGHFWNLVQLNGEWYHCDATVFMNHPGIYFMCTDDEIDDYRHQYNGALYPERAGGSKEFLPSPTPTPTNTPSPTPTVTPTPAPTATAAPTPEPTNTPIPEITLTPTPEPTENTEPSESEEPTEPSGETEPSASEPQNAVTQ